MALSIVTNTFAGNPLDRATERRGDAAWLDARRADPAARAVALWNGEVLVQDDGGDTRLARLPIDTGLVAAPGEEPWLFLGLDGEAPVFAIDIEGADDPTGGLLAGQGRFVGLRALAASLSGPEGGVAATAKAVFEWRRRHRFCAVCGTPSQVAEGGWKRVCPACGGEHFPRTDPVVIMLPVAGERCLLGHNARFPAGLFSALAGFVEPGETLEEACARELKEEARLQTLTVTYHSSQPWPFPSSLMIGLIAEVADTQALADLTELEEVRWFTRDQARALLENQLEGAFCPPLFAIAHQLIASWAYAGLRKGSAG